MAERDITVNINGNGSGGSGTPPSPTPGAEGVGDDARLTASVSELVTEIRNALARVNEVNSNIAVVYTTKHIRKAVFPSGCVLS